MYKTQAEAAKDWLMAYRENEKHIDDQLDKLRTLKARMMSVGAQQLTDMPKGGGMRDKMAEYVIQVEKLETEIKNDIEVQEQSKKVIRQLLMELKKPEERKIIEYRYLFGLDWNDVMDRLYRGEKKYGQAIESYRRRMYRAHEDALEKLAKMWTKKK